MRITPSEVRSGLPAADPADIAVTVVIKALDEEAYIARAVQSARSALAAMAAAGLGRGEVILADSRSRDRTAEIAAACGARVARLGEEEARGCGVGPQLGYQYARGRFVCLIDGDMVLDPGFLTAALGFLRDNPRVAGVGGAVRDVNVVNLEFRRRALRGAADLRPGPVDRLNGGGLYRREAVDEVGHFSDRNLHGYEEFDIAVRLRAAGWTLHRLAVPFVDHHGHVIGGYALLRRRVRSRYLDGIGEMLRAALGRPHLATAWRDLPEIRLWLGVYLGWVVAAVVAVAVPAPAKLAVLAGLIALPVAALGLRYRSPALGLYAFVAWNAHAFGMARGFLRRRVPPGTWIDSTIAEPDEPTGAVSSRSRPEPPPVRASRVLAVWAALAVALAAVMPVGRVDAEPAQDRVEARRQARAPADEADPGSSKGGAAKQGRGAASDRSAIGHGSKWVAVRDHGLEVAEGSPLDFSGLGLPAPAGSRGRVVASPAGNLALAGDPARRVRFLCASLAWSPASGSYPDKPTADRYARQLRIHGYTIARFHFTDAILMDGRARDFDVDPEQLDRFRYLLAALKRNGIYWMIDAMTSQAGALGGVEDRWGDEHDLKLRVHVDEDARAHWRRLVRTVYGSVNPYTGLPPLADPALALVILVNENGVEFASILAEKRAGRPYPDALKAPFNAWLAKTYGGTAALRTAWTELARGESLEAGTVRLPADRGERGPRMRDLQRFFLSLEAATLSWMSAEIAGLGYPGLVSAYNNWTTTGSDLGRVALPVVTMNAYYDEVPSFDPGTTITQRSSLDESEDYLRELIGRRRFGRPFVATEYDQLFWNRFRHEAGLVVPAYAAFQGWDAICRHGAGPIDLSFDQPWPHKRAMLPYGISLDPVARAGETLAALLFRRGDVAEARGGVALPFGEVADLTQDGQGRLPDAITEIGLVTRFGLASGAGAVPPGVSLLPRRAHAEATPFAARLDALRRDGAVEADNLSDAAAGLYESAGRQILLDTRARLARVVTPRTVAASYQSLPAPLRLGPVTIEAASGPALLAASAVDGRDLAASRRVLLIFATDAMNTGMRFRDAERRVVAEFGRMPVLIERQTVRLRMLASKPRSWRARSLHLDGSAGEAMRLTADEHGIVLDLDNAAASHGPTTYFLLEAVS